MLSIRPILVFTSKYTSNKDFNRAGVDNSREIIELAFFTSKGLNLSKEDAIIVNNNSYVQANDRISEYIKSIDKNNDLCFFYFCGHGFADYSQKTVYMSFTDTTDKNFNACGYDVNRLVSMIKANRIKNYIVILDCCHSGFLCGMGEKTDIHSAETIIEGGGGVFISSTMAQEVCYQTIIDGRYYLPFSYHFANVLMGKYCEKNKLWSINEVYKCVQDKLEISDYPCRTEIQCKSRLSDLAIFNIHGEGNQERGFFQFSKHFELCVLNVLLVKTSIDHPIKQDDFGVPLGLWMLKGYLSTTGLSINVDIFDERLELTKCGDNITERQAVLDGFSDVIQNYDVIGISMCSSEVIPALRKFKIAKAAGKITFCGGIFTTSNEECLLKTGLIDYVVPGVGTIPLGNLLGRLLQEKKQNTLGHHTIDERGVASSKYLYRFDSPWVPAQLPTMRQSMWPEILKRYSPYLQNRMDVYTARGCDKNCSFCSVQLESKQVVYRKEEMCVIEEIEYLKKAGINYFSFKDEDFLSMPDRMLRILRTVAGDNIKFKIRARYDEMVTSGITLNEMRDLGIDEIQYGIESPDIYIRRSVRKGFVSSKKDDLVKFIRNHSEYGITANCSFILGINGESVEYYEELYNFIKAIYSDSSKPKIYINFLTPHPYNSRFPLDNYSLVTDDLNFFTHKFPVCYSNNSTYGERKRMLETYDQIVKYSNSETYNPLTDKMPEELKNKFQKGQISEKREVTLRP